MTLLSPSNLLGTRTQNAGNISPNLRLISDAHTCRPEIVSFDTVFEDGIFSCQPDEGQCPGLGGVVVGCDSTPPLPPVPMPQCQMTQNPYGECGCSQQGRWRYS